MLEQECENIDTNVFDWIAKNVIKDSFDAVGNPISRFIPPYFECYCKILHPFIIDSEASDLLYNEKHEKRRLEQHIMQEIYDNLTLEDKSLLDLDFKDFQETVLNIILKRHNKRFVPELSLADMPNGKFKDEMSILLKTPLKQVFLKFMSIAQSASKGEKLGINPIAEREFDNVKYKKKVKWAEIAQKYGLEFHHNISIESFRKKFDNIGFPMDLYFPHYGLDREDSEKLLGVLKQFSKTQKVLMRPSIYADTYGIVNYICPIEKMLKDEDNDDALKGGYIVDSNQDWILYTDDFRDLQMTILGGSKQLIDTLHNHIDLEVIECPESSRVDYYSDAIN